MLESFSLVADLHGGLDRGRNDRCLDSDAGG